MSVNFSKELQILLSTIIASALASITLIGYIFDAPTLITLLIKKQPMVLITALSVMVAAVAITISNYQTPATYKKWLNAPGVILILISITVILETVLGQSWLDFPFIHQQVASDYPGRMSVNTAICTFMIGLCFIVINKPESRVFRFLLGLCLSLTVTIALFGLIGYFANFEFLLTFGQTNKMAIPTAVAYIALAVGIFLLSKKMHPPSADINFQKIYFTLEYLLVLVVAVVALASYASAQQRVESLMASELDLTGKHARLYFNDVINFSAQMASINASRPEMIHALKTDSGKKHMKSLFNDLEKSGYKALDLCRTDNTCVFSAGFSKRPARSIKISDTEQIYLEWSDGYQLRTIKKISNGHRQIGYVESVIALTRLGDFQQTIVGKPGTSDLVICGLENDYQICFPFRWNPKPAKYYAYLNGKELPVTKAAHGIIETTVMTDYRGKRVMTALGPIGDTRLGMALKVDMQDLYEPIRKQFYASFPLLIIFVICSIGLMRLKLKPLLEELELSRLKMRHMALHDGLTLLANRGLFNDHLINAIKRLSRNHHKIALFYLDIDYFKNINDSYGHLIGDELLVWFAQMLQGCVRDTDTVARIGGDEFAIILENSGNTENIAHIAEKIVRNAQQKLDILCSGPVENISTSIGIVFTGRPDVTPDELMQRADEALYQAKQNGRNAYFIADEI